jgi:putative hydrolase of the HAD superfamily
VYLFFDLDDTLLDTASAEHRAALAFAARFPEILGSDAEGFSTSWHNIATYYFDKWSRGELTYKEQRRCRVRQYFGSDLSNEESDRIFSIYHDLSIRHWSSFSDVQPMLIQLQGYPLAILSNGDPEQQRAKLVELGISEWFPLLITPMDAGVCKPDKRIFQQASSQAGVQPADCLYIGDQLDSDVRAARNAGWQGIWLDRSNNGQKVTDVPVIHSLAELPGLLEFGLT